MTRARNHLDLMVPQRFYVSHQHGQGDRHVYGTISRFIPGDVRTLFESCSPTAPSALPDAQVLPYAKLDASAMARSQWRS